MEIIKNISQTSDKWFKLRALRMTASEAQAIGNCGKGLETYILNKMCEYYATNKTEKYDNDDLRRGKEREPQAIFLYENEYNCIVEQVCFVIKNDYVGCSPDGLINSDGLIEVKSLNDINFFKLLLEYKSTGKFTIKSEHLWQIQMQLENCEREWCDYVVYNPNFTPQILVQRVYPDLEKFKSLNKGYELGKKLIIDIQKKYNNTSEF